MQIPDPLPDAGFSVPVVASFLGLKRVPLIALAHNSASPRLVLFADGVECRVLATQRRPLAALERVDILQVMGTQNVELIWRDSLFTFSAHLGEEGRLVTVLGFFERRGLPLTARARVLLERHRAAAER